jgi:hypothetical protein
MVEGRLKTGLFQKLVKFRGLLMGNFDGHLDVQPGVLRQINRAESPAAKRTDDLVFPDLLSLDKNL